MRNACEAKAGQGRHWQHCAESRIAAALQLVGIRYVPTAFTAATRFPNPDGQCRSSIRSALGAVSALVSN
jgi:hypothetical protein